jgi:uncharacterized protein (TIGR03086 family)
MGNPRQDAREWHRRSLDGFSAVVRAVPATRWAAPSPCNEWDARAVVEHVIGIHEFLLLRPLGVRAHRPRTGPAARWLATDTAASGVLEDPTALARDVEFFDGARRRPAELLPSLATDTLVHTWDLARATGVASELDPKLCRLAYGDAVSAGEARARSGLYAPEVPVAAGAPLQDRLLGLLGRDPRWSRTAS